MNVFRDLQERLYEFSTSFGELRALERLFTDEFLNGISQSEKAALGNDVRRTVHVDFAWVDKIPLAKFKLQQQDLEGHEIIGRVELGDLLIHRTDSLITNSGVHVRDSRSVIVQAKLTNQEHPFVPVGRISATRCTSTSKELKLLRDWPAFDLYEASRSLMPALKDIHVDSREPHSFFAAFVKQNKSWLFGKALPGSPCNIDFDQFLAHLRGKICGARADDDSHWAKLTHKVLSIAVWRSLPPSLSKLNKILRSRVQRATYQTAGFSLSLPAKRRMAVLTIDVVFDETG